MPYAGNTDTPHLDLDVFAVDTAVTLILTSPDGVVGSPITATSDVTHQHWQAAAPYPDPGNWQLKWTVTGTGAKTVCATVGVIPFGPAGDVRHTYATTKQLAIYLNDAPPADAARMLRDASALVDDLILTAVYDTDDAGLPTDATIAQALAEAVCEQVKWRIATGDDTDAPSVFTGTGMAGLSLSRRTGRGGGPAQIAGRVGPGVPAILVGAGLLGRGPWVW